MGPVSYFRIGLQKAEEPLASDNQCTLKINYLDFSGTTLLSVVVKGNFTGSVFSSGKLSKFGRTLLDMATIVENRLVKVPRDVMKTI